MPEPTLVDADDFEGVVHKVSVDTLTWRPGAYAAVIKDGSILLLRQINGYDLPGGGIELGEMLEDAVLREVKEETGVTVSNPRIIGASSGIYIPFKQAPDQAKQAVKLYYTCDYVEGELSAEGFDAAEQAYAEAPEWVPLDKLDSIKIGSVVDFRPHIKKALRA